MAYKKFQLDWELIRSSPRDGFRDGWGGWHLYNGASSKIDDVLAEVGGLLHVLLKLIMCDQSFSNSDKGRVEGFA